jgi:serine/threonine-protein kinase
MDELIGKTFGPYTLVSKLGEGGMAVVYKGYQESLNRYVAIKVLRGELARDQEFITRFRREALAVAKLSHPNILHVYDAGEAHGIYYIAMDYADGGSLKDRIQQGNLTMEQAIDITAQLADALDYAHRQGLVHRDVKPSNVLMSTDGRPLLTDFGIAKVLSQSTHLTRTGTSIGTPEYMAPEQLQGQEVDGRADIYALGVVLYELLSGWSPFSAPTPMAIMYKQMNEPPPPLRQMNVTIPTWLEGVVDKALAKQPQDRFQRASEMATALRQKQSPVAAPSPGRKRTKTPAPMAPAKPSAKKKGSAVPLLVGIIALLVLAVGAGAAYLFLGGDGGGSPTVVVVVSPEATETRPLMVVATFSPTPEPTDAPVEPTAVPETPTPVVVVVTATGEPTQPPTTVPPTDTPPPPTDTPAPVTAPTNPPPAAVPAPSDPGLIANFESFGTWKRGDEPNGTFTQSNAQAYKGSYSGKLDYTFNSSANDYVVFQQTHALSGAPTRITAWVYGDGAGHFLNVWIKDAGGQLWQAPLGTVSHTGWQQMVGAIDVNQPWPWTHISGTDNGKVDYPISFMALVLDDKPDTFQGNGTIYIDELRADTGSVGANPAPAPTQPASAAAPTNPPASSGLSVSGKMVFSAGGALHIVNAQTGKDLVAPVGGMYQPDLRADGQLIVANGEGGGKTSIWTINAQTGAFVREQSPFTNDFRPFWSPDGGQFAYDSYHQGGKFANTLMLYKQVLDSKDDQPLIHGGAAILGSSPVWMHDDWIAFTACDYWPGGSGGSNCGIYRMPSWGGQPVIIHAGSLTMRATDNYGSQIVFQSQESGNWEVYIISSKGGAAKNLSNSPGSNDGLATFSPDGSMVAFVSNRSGAWAIWVVRADGSGLTKLFNLPDRPSGPTWGWTEEQISWGP